MRIQIQKYQLVQYLEYMTEETQVQIIIHQSQSCGQQKDTIKIEMDPDSDINQLIEFLTDQGKLKIPKQNIQVIYKGTPISLLSKISDCTYHFKTTLDIIQKSTNNNPKPNPKMPQVQEITQQNNHLIQPQNRLIIESSISNSDFMIPSPAQIHINQQQQPKQSVQTARKELIHQPKSNPTTVHIPKQIVLKIQLVDGDKSISFDFTKATDLDTLQDLKKDINLWIIDKNLMEGWKEDQEVKVFYNCNVFKKEKYPFQKINLVDPNGQIKFVFNRLYPGGGK